MNIRTHMILPLLALFPVSCSAQKIEHAIEMKAARPEALVAERIPLEAHVSYQPAGEWKGYWSTVEREPMSCTSDHGVTLTEKRVEVGTREPKHLMALPYVFHAPAPESGYFTTPPLPSGHWNCQLRIHLEIANQEGKSNSVILISDQVGIIVLEPTDEDKAVLKEAGLDKSYLNGNNSYDWIDKHVVAINLHPESTYYCRYYANGHRNGKSKAEVIENGHRFLTPHQDWAVQMHSDVQLPKALQESLIPLDNMLKYKCSEITPEEIWFMKSLRVLNVGYFEVAKQYATEGRKVANDPRYIEWFDRVISFKTSSDFLAVVSPASSAKAK